MLDDLKRPDRLVELLPRLDVVERDLEGTLAQADKLGRGKRRCIGDSLGQCSGNRTAAGQFHGRGARKRKLAQRAAVGLRSFVNDKPVRVCLGQNQNRAVISFSHDQEP